MMQPCPICSAPEADVSGMQPHGDEDFYEVRCRLCGEYRITHRAAKFSITEYKEKAYILSGVVRNRFARGERLLISDANLSILFEEAMLPVDPVEAIDLLLIYLSTKTKWPGEAIQLNAREDYPILYSKNDNEFLYYARTAQSLDLIETQPKVIGPEFFCWLSIGGWRRIRDLKQARVRSDQAFVAMWFDGSLEEAWKYGFKEALSVAGYIPIRIDLTEHNEKICDRIIAEIRKSGLLIADFTGQRGGVYFEAGFAMGLGIPVIWTCRQDDSENLHFDTRQYNHILWSEPEDLRKKLVNRIEATIPAIKKKNRP